ncbi:hypothetical protein B296_00024141 [Ensete ventricosum]|uniref:Uncharacterized protein n=1 Tax=Ensete ventricosum TaxID=4639 RepID=A0A426YDC5_ENSVE|nr:hypothetical protein B296_00024141 [Ensete ventricosum]
MCTTIAEEGNSGIEQEMLLVMFTLMLIAIKIVWQQKIAAGYDVDQLQRKIAAGSFLPQKIAAGCDQG